MFIDKSISKQIVNVIPACRESFFSDRFDEEITRKIPNKPE
jgi:hypothetical protein